MPTYQFQHPETGEIFEEFRLMADYDLPFYAPDGEECQRLISAPTTIIDKNQEVFQMDEDYTRLTNPKYIKYKDGHKEKYNPSKHIGGKGKSFDLSKIEDKEINLPPTGKSGRKIFRGGIWWIWNVSENSWEQESKWDINILK